MRTSLRQQPTEAVTAAAACDIYPTRARSSVALGELLTAGAEPRLPGPFKQAAECGAARRQRQAFKRDCRASAGDQVNT